MNWTGWAWLSSERMTIGVDVRDGVVVRTPPIARIFVGQKYELLRRWMEKQPGFEGIESGIAW